MTIAVCLPTYNRAKLLPVAIHSILAQTSPNWNLFIYDDGSTDNTQEVITQCMNHLNKNVRSKITVVRELENRGNGYCRKWFKHNVKADWYMWQDSDDYSHRDRILVHTRRLLEAPADVNLSHLAWFMGESPNAAPQATRTIRKINIAKYSSNVRSIHNNTNTGTAVFSRKAAELIPDVEINHGGWDTLWHMALITGGCTFSYLERALYYCRRHSGRIVNRRNDPKYTQVRQEEQILLRQELLKLGVRGLQ